MIFHIICWGLRHSLLLSVHWEAGRDSHLENVWARASPKLLAFGCWARESLNITPYPDRVHEPVDITLGRLLTLT